MIVERITDILQGAAMGGFAAIWLGIVVSAAATVPVVGFAVAIPAGLVVYSLRAALTGRTRDRIEGARA